MNAITHGRPPPLHGAVHLSLPRIPPILEFDSLSPRRRDRAPHVQGRNSPAEATHFEPFTTSNRWAEEAKILFATNAQEKGQRVINSILKLLVPPAIRKAKEEAEQRERARKLKEEADTRAREEKERAEREAQAKKEQEDREAAEAEARAKVAAEEATSEDVSAEDQPAALEAQSMEGIETSQPTQDNTERTSQEPERVMYRIRDREINIAALGIDIEYLEALPEEMREEVLLERVAAQRSEAIATGEAPTGIDAEFLDALPPEIREELLQHEAQDRRRREREEARRRDATSGAPAIARAEEMDPASFFASLEPGLRQTILMEQDHDMLGQLPPDIANEARALVGVERGGERRAHPHYGGRYAGRNFVDVAQKRSKMRPAAQLLDKAGIATLMRLLFLPQDKRYLNETLANVCQNRQNRVEVISMLLSILQDGTADVSAVERSFAQLSIRAKHPGSQKTPQPKRSLTSQMTSQLGSSPLMIVQQCLGTLKYLANKDGHIASFFLSEHEVGPGLKARSSKKGKGKDTKAQKYPLNALLGLLDRNIIIDSSAVMEELTELLQKITAPLQALLKKDSEKPDTSAANTTPATNDTADASNSAEATTSARDTAAPATASISTEDSSAVPPATASNTAPESSATGVIEAEKPKETAREEEATKKQRSLVPPEIPDTNLRMVINILAAPECSGKTFRATLSIVSHLSAIPGAKGTFGLELVKQAQDLAKNILGDLGPLSSQIAQAKSATDVQGLALAKFSPPNSEQVKLLRAITALDYVFDPKKTDSQEKPAGDESNAVTSAQRQDILTTLYESSTFESLWNKLSECLTAIRLRGNMLNIATILQPLIEVLMLVCKNTTSKDNLLSKSHQKDFALSSPPPESRIESLFFSFTEEHRKILNELVRNNPKLMTAAFSLLVKNSKVLEFDNKRNYFTRRLHTRTDAPHLNRPLQLAVRRDQVFLDSFKSLYYKSADEMKYGKLSIRFHGEEGVDAGGVTREWFQALSRQMFDPNYVLFVPVASDRTTFHPNRLSHVNPEHLTFFKFIARIIGKALYEGRVLDCHFSRAVYKRILGKPVSVKDMETLDLDYYKSLLWMLENDITDIITETFSTESEDFGNVQIIDLIPNGRNIPVTEDNKQEYVRLIVEYRLTGSVKEQLEHFLGGFHDIVPAELISIFNEQELELLISGLPDIDVDDWKANTEYHNYTVVSPQVQWFWRAVRSFDKEEQAKLLQFVTGTSKVPLNGFKELEGMNGFSKFNIHRDFGNKDRLPSAHTCFNQLDLPEYVSYEKLREQLLMAITAGSEYFGFA